MLPYRSMIDDIRAALAAMGDNALDTCDRALIEYRRAVRDVNTRLRLCESHLNDGLRSEAIQLCESEPNLIDSVAILQFPELPYLNQLLTKRRNDTVPPLLEGVVSKLNDALSQERPLAVLLRQHRLLALAYSPLRQRLAVLRSLAATDAANSVWRSDIQAFEQKRLQELAVEVPEALKAGAESVLVALEQELAQGWQTATIGDDHLPRIKAAIAKLARQRARAELIGIEADLHAAHSRCDSMKARNLKIKWSEMVERAEIQADDELCKSVAPILDWLQDEDKREAAAAERQAAEAALEKQRELAAAEQQAAVAAFETALLAGKSARALQESYDLVKSRGNTLSGKLEARFHARLRSLQLSARQRSRAAVIGIIAIMILVGIAGVAIFRQYRHREQLALHSATLEAFISDGRTADAEAYLAQLRLDWPKIAESVEIHELSSRVKGQRTKEEKRAANFERLLSRVTEGGHEQPDQDALDEARRISVTSVEKSRIAAVEHAIRAERQRIVAERQEAFDKRTTELSERFKALELAGNSTALSTRRKGVETLLQDVTSLEHDGAFASVEGKKVVVKLRTDTTALIANLKHGETEAACHDSLTTSIGDIGNYQNALSDYLKALRVRRRVDDVKRAMSEHSSWEAVAEWNSTTKLWAKDALAGITPNKAEDLKNRTITLMQKCNGFPETGSIQSRIPYLLAITRRIDAEGTPIVNSLQRTFKSPIISGVWMIEEKGHFRYYCLAEPRVEKGKFTKFRYVSALDLTQSEHMVLGDNVIYHGLAPQAKVSRVLLPSLMSLNDGNWEQIVSEAIVVIAAETELDPILKCDLLRQTLSVGCTGSYSIEQAFTRHLRLLSDSRVDRSANWLDAFGPAAAKQRGLASETLNELTGIAAAVEKAGRDSSFFSAGVKCPTYRWFGWLGVSDDETWRCMYKTAPIESGKLFIVVGPTLGQQCKLEPVGTLDHGKARIDQTAKSSLVEGRPVFVEISP